MPTDPQLVPRREGDGTDAYGLFLDFIVYDASGLLRQERYFLADNILCKYVRQKGNARAAWRPFPLPSHDDARTLLLRNVMQYGKEDKGERIEMVHQPLIVELTPTDIDALKRHEAPGARFAATDAITKAAGKIDDATWAPKS
jgi:hypothetical protein